ncbi:MAG TPA: PstS family phosphate ABC transporter substrate-binding protein [Fimbriimonas sp.]|nr:PstS family phosphate ABC transporter substrate-binding protein [Fimbriimonas sp.]
MIKKLAILASSAVILGGGIANAQSVSIKGSDTLLPLNQRWAEVFGNSHPNVNVAVTGGGSSIGINAFINGVADICASSRPMRKSEVDKARSRGTVVNEIPVALDGLAIAVNDDNPVDTITMDDLRKVYVGQITNWKQLGGSDQPIVVFSRDSNSGTYGFFQSNVLRNQGWGAAVRFLPSTSEEVREVARTSGGVAYGGVAYFKGKKGIKVLSVSAKKGDQPYRPNEDNVRSRKYPIWRYLYYYTNGAPRGATATFINWALSPAGQKIVEEVGYYSLK